MTKVSSNISFGILFFVVFINCNLSLHQHDDFLRMLSLIGGVISIPYIVVREKHLHNVD